MQRRAAAAVALFVAIEVVLGSPSARAAGVGAVVVPQDVAPAAAPAAAPASCSDQGAAGIAPCYPSTAATPYPAPSTGAVNPVGASLPRGMMANISDNMLGKVDSWFAQALDAAVVVGQWLYIRIAAISIVLAFLMWFVAGESLAAIVRTLYWRMLEAVMWLALIGWTWKSPVGPGWFPLIIGGMAAIGAAIANQVAGASVIPTGTPATLDVLAGGQVAVLPGTILDLAASTFSVIGAYAWASFAGQDTSNPWIDSAKAVVSIVGGALTGTLFISGMIYLLTMLLGITLYATLALVAFRYFYTVIKVYVLGCLLFVQGLAGSRRLSVYGGGFLSIAITLGAEFALVTVLVGIFYHIVVGLIQFTGYWPIILNVASSAATLNPAPILATVAATAQFGFSIGMLMLLDLIAALWLILVWKVPEFVAHFFSGTVSVSTNELVQAFKNSPTLAGKFVGAGAGATNAVSQRGPVMPLFEKMMQMGGIGAIGASGANGSAKSVAEGAMKGAMVGGPEGAVIGGASAWLFGRRSAQREGADAGGTIRSGSAPGRDGADAGAQGSATADTNDLTRSRKVTTRTQHQAAGQDDDDMSRVGEAPGQTRSRTVTEDVRLAQAVREFASLAAAMKGGQAGSGATLGASNGGRQLGALGGGDAQRSGGFAGFMEDLAANTRVSDMIARRFVYSANFAASRGHQPLPDPVGAQIAAPPLTLGER